MRNKIKEIRYNRNLSLRDLSKLTHVSFSYISKLENGIAKNPRIGTKILISKGLKMPLKELFFNDDEEKEAK